MDFHELAEAFPLMQGAEYQELVEDVRAHGLIEPIVTHEGKILDGRNRYRACMDAGIDPHFRDWAGEHGNVAAFVWAENGLRRHLNVGQRAVISLAFLPRLEAEAQKRVQQHSGTAPGRAAENTRTEFGTGVSEPKSHASRSVVAAAKLVGIGATSTQQAKRLGAAAEKDEKSARLFERVRTGSLTLNSAMRQLGPATPRNRPTQKATPASAAAGEHEATITPLPTSWSLAHPAEMLIANLGAFRREVERQGETSEAVLAAWWEGIEWREWEAARSDVLWFREHCMPVLNYIYGRRDRTPPMVRKYPGPDAQPKPKRKQA